MAIETQKTRYCENCEEETLQHAYEDAMQLEFRCTQCNETTEIVKSFF